MPSRPAASEAAEYYFTYINKVGAGEILTTLAGQLPETLALLEGISEEKSLYRYAPGKWSLRECLNHITDCERVFALRALWFARGFDTPQPSFDQDVAVAGAQADGVKWAAHIEEFRRVRLATIALFENMPAGAWTQTGVASGNPFTVNALAYIIAGHVAHHIGVIRERYL